MNGITTTFSIIIFTLLCSTYGINASVNYQFALSPNHVCGASMLSWHDNVINNVRCVRSCVNEASCVFTHFCAADDRCILYASAAACMGSGADLCGDGSEPEKASLNDISNISAASIPSMTTGYSSYPTSAVTHTTMSTMSSAPPSTTTTLSATSSTPSATSSTPSATSSTPSATSTSTSSVTSSATISTMTTASTMSTSTQPPEELEWTFGYEFHSATYSRTHSIGNIIAQVQNGAEIRISFTLDDAPDDVNIFTPEYVYTTFGGFGICAYYHQALARTGAAFKAPPEHWLIAICGATLQQQGFRSTSYENLNIPIYPAFKAKWFYRARSQALPTVFQAQTETTIPDDSALLAQMNLGYTFRIELANKFFFSSKSHHFTNSDRCAQSVWASTINSVDGLMDVANKWKIRQICTSGVINIIDVPIATTEDSSASSELTFQPMVWKTNDYWVLAYKHGVGSVIDGSYGQLEDAIDIGRKIRVKTSNFSGAAIGVYKSNDIITAVVADYLNPDPNNDTLLSDTNIYRKYYLFSTNGFITEMSVNIFDESLSYSNVETNEDISWFVDRDYWDVTFDISDPLQPLIDKLLSGSDATVRCDVAGEIIMMYPDGLVVNDNLKTVYAGDYQLPVLTLYSPGVYGFLIENLKMKHDYRIVADSTTLVHNVWQKPQTNIDVNAITTNCRWYTN